MVKVLLNPFLYIPVFQIYWSLGGGIYRNRLSVCPSLCGNFCPARRCVAYIPDPNTTLTLDLKVKFTGFYVWYITIFWFDIGIPYLAYGSTTMRGCVAYIHNPDSRLTFVCLKFIVPLERGCCTHRVKFPYRCCMKNRWHKVNHKLKKTLKMYVFITYF